MGHDIHREIRKVVGKAFQHGKAAAVHMPRHHKVSDPDRLTPVFQELESFVHRINRLLGSGERIGAGLRTEFDVDKPDVHNPRQQGQCMDIGEQV